MTCHEARELFSADLDDALTLGERSGVEAHVAGCPECRREQARFRATVAALRAVEPARAPVGFVDRVLEAARPLPWHERLRRRLFSPLALRRPIEVTVVALVALTAVYLYERTPELRQTAGPASVRPMSEPKDRQKAMAPAARAPSTESPARPAPPAAAAKKEQADQSRDALRSAATPPAAPQPVERQSAGRPPLRDAPAPSAQSETGLAAEAGKRRQTEEYRALGGATSSTTPPSASPAEPAPPASPGATAAAVAPPMAEESEKKTSAVEQRADARRREAAGLAKSAAPAAAPSVAGRMAAVAPEVVGTLAVSDRAAARQAIGTLVARVGGRELPRPPDAPADAVEILLPAGAYPELVAGLARVGRWEPSRQPAELPAQLRVRLVLTD